jgi:hypothetical protein
VNIPEHIPNSMGPFSSFLGINELIHNFYMKQRLLSSLMSRISAGLDHETVKRGKNKQLARYMLSDIHHSQDAPKGVITSTLVSPP